MGGSLFSISDDDTEVDEEAADGFTMGGSVAAFCGGAGRPVGALVTGSVPSVAALFTGAGSSSMVSFSSSFDMAL